MGVWPRQPPYIFYVCKEIDKQNDTDFSDSKTMTLRMKRGESRNDEARRGSTGREG
jgi:hypothetical protein